MFVKNSQHAIIISTILIAILAVAIPLSSESFAKPEKCSPWPGCREGDGGGGGGKTPFEWNIALSPNSISINQETSTTVDVTITHVSGSGNVNLSAANVPAGVTVSFNPTSSKISSNNPSFSSTATIDILSTANSGTIDVQATGKGTTKTTPLVLTISDTIAPQTTINSNPTDPSDDDTPSFTFSANEPATFECDVDGNGFATCTSSDSFGTLADGTHTFQVRAIDIAGNTDLTPASYSWGIDTTLPPPPSVDPVIVAAGDIACNSGAGSSTCHYQATSDLVMAINPDAVLTLGDNQYQNGELANDNTYEEPTWGRAFDKTYPSPGNHEYGTPFAAGYFDYYGIRAGSTENGYYSFDIGSWHIVSLNSNCTGEGVGGCAANSPQAVWLENDLSASNNACTLVYWHHPRYGAGSHGDKTKMDYFWQLLDANNVDVALAGHDHNYQRFAPMDLTGSADSNGVREFVVGTGGKSHYSLNSSDDNLEVYNTSAYGVLKMTLHDTSYDWEFVGESANTIDSGNWNCNVN